LKGLYSLAPGEQANKVEQLKLDFQYMNYSFCKEHQFSNEQTSTLLGIFDHVLLKMLERGMTADGGLAMLKGILNDHSIHRPPFSIYVFSPSVIEEVSSFATTTFLRHFSLYEFAYKPRVELIMKT
jgi:hypothetical protein